MKVIVEHKENESSYLNQYATYIEPLSHRYKIVAIKEEHLHWLTELAQCVEPNFIIKLEQEEVQIENAILKQKDIILALIGTQCLNSEISYCYNLQTHKVSQPAISEIGKKGRCINCCSESHVIDAASYIRCIRYLTHLADELNKTLVIYANIQVPEKNYRYRSLTHKIINEYLEPVNGVLILKSIKEEIYKYYHPVEKSCTFYHERALYFEEGISVVLDQVLPLLKSAKNNERFKQIYEKYRQIRPLYDDIFYNSISPDEEIYIVLNLGSFKQPEYYEALGFEIVRLIGNYSMIYGRKSQFDALSDVLRSDITAEYKLAISSYTSCMQMQEQPYVQYSFAPQEVSYKGEGVYIGVITVDDVDYTSDVLRNPDGTSRLAYIWQQTRADDGESYFKEQINAALVSGNPGVHISLPDSDSISTMVLGIAGGSSETRPERGIAVEAEFIAARLNTASEALQRIYGGSPTKYASTLPDILVAMTKLIAFAVQQGRPLVLCIPFNANIDAHDSSLILQQALAEMARTPSLTVISPVGEEADKQHHYSLKGRQNTLGPISIRVGRPNQNVVGVMYQRYPTLLTSYLYPPVGIPGGPINLKEQGVTRIGEATIYANGERVDFLNGSRRTLFRIDNPYVGEWQIRGAVQPDRESEVDLWLTQQELNPYITLSPADPFTTTGSTANIHNIMSVGGYDQTNMIVLRSSGRGYSWDNRVKPLLVTHASGIAAPCRRGEWANVSGTLPAASIMLGVAASLYNKAISEQVSPLPNTLVMSTTILSVIRQFEGINYPNPSQGYGLFDMRSLGPLLAAAYLI